MTPIVDYLAPPVQIRERRIKHDPLELSPAALQRFQQKLIKEVFGGDANGWFNPAPEQRQAALKWFNDGIRRYSDELSVKRLKERLGR